jgi:GNAT superfamily N-acetyltransferase
MGFSTLPLGLQLISAPDPAAMEEIYRLRARAWRARSASFPPIDRWVDPDDDRCLHWCIVDGVGTVVAAARLSVHHRLDEAPEADIYPATLAALTGPFGFITRLIVSPEHGGLGLSRALDQARIAAASKAGCRVIVGATRSGDRRLRSLTDLGFRTVGVALPTKVGPLAMTDGEAVVIVLKLEIGERSEFAGLELAGGRS